MLGLLLREQKVSENVPGRWRHSNRVLLCHIVASASPVLGSDLDRPPDPVRPSSESSSRRRAERRSLLPAWPRRTPGGHRRRGSGSPVTPGPTVGIGFQSSGSSPCLYTAQLETGQTLQGEPERPANLDANYGQDQRLFRLTTQDQAYSSCMSDLELRPNLMTDRVTAERSPILRGLVGSTVHGMNVNDGIAALVREHQVMLLKAWHDNFKSGN